MKANNGENIWLGWFYKCAGYATDGAVEIYSNLIKVKFHDDCVNAETLPQTFVLRKMCNTLTFFSYCINKESAHTLKAFRAYKTLDAYKLFVSGWIHEHRIKNSFGWISDKCSMNFRPHFIFLLIFVINNEIAKLGALSF